MMPITMADIVAIGKLLLCLVYAVLLYYIGEYDKKKKKIPNEYNLVGHLIVLFSYFFGNEYVGIAYLTFIVSYFFAILSPKIIGWGDVLLLPHFVCMMVFLNPAIAIVLFVMMVVYSLLKNKEMETAGSYLFCVYAIALFLYLGLLPFELNMIQV